MCFLPSWGIHHFTEDATEAQRGKMHGTDVRHLLLSYLPEFTLYSFSQSLQMWVLLLSLFCRWGNGGSRSQSQELGWRPMIPARALNQVTTLPPRWYLAPCQPGAQKMCLRGPGHSHESMGYTNLSCAKELFCLKGQLLKSSWCWPP